MNKLSFVAVAMVLSLSACVPPQDTRTEATPAGLDDNIQRVDSNVLLENAEEMARQELARLSAAELIYRHTVVEHLSQNPVSGVGSVTLNKMYRELTHAEVEDIYRSESYLYPITVKIRFDYQLFATVGRPKTVPNALILAQRDSGFELKDKYSIFRWYRCDDEGKHIGELPPMLPRPNLENIRYFDHEQGAGLLNPYPPGEAPKTYPRRFLRPFN